MAVMDGQSKDTKGIAAAQAGGTQGVKASPPADMYRVTGPGSVRLHLSYEPQGGRQGFRGIRQLHPYRWQKAGIDDLERFVQRLAHGCPSQVELTA